MNMFQELKEGMTKPWTKNQENTNQKLYEINNTIQDLEIKLNKEIEIQKKSKVKLEMKVEVCLTEI